MKFSFHNQITIKTNNEHFTFFNEMLPSIFSPLSASKEYNKNLAVGIGTTHSIANNHLENCILTLEAESFSYQNNIENNPLFSKIQFKLDSRNINYDYITEVGLCDDNKTNPTIYNYYNFISEELPNGIYIKDDDEVVLEVIIYLEINEEKQNFLTSNNNDFIKFLLGGGLGDVFACRGSNYSNNERVNREIPLNAEKFICEKQFEINDGFLKINFNCDIGFGECNEILFMTEESVFARINTKEINNTSIENRTISPKNHFVIDLCEDIKNVNSVINQTNQLPENYIYISKHANSFGDKISLPFNNMFSSDTPRFLSKDGNKIFFIHDDIVYGYENKNFKIQALILNQIKTQCITKIISFENNIFVISKVEPYIHSFKIINNTAIQISNNFNELEHYEKFKDYRMIDVTMSKNETFMLSFIDSNGVGYTTYFTFNSESGFICGNTKRNDYNFSYLISMYKTNFTDAKVIFLQEGENSTNCRIVTHEPNENVTDVYSSLAYHYTNNTKEAYAKGRAVIVEKNTTPYLLIYYYPQVFEYKLPLLSNELDDYISTNTNYLIQKTSDNEYHVYNLIGYDEPEEFVDGLPKEINQNKIEDFEFLDDTLLIFLKNNPENIVAYNLNLNKTQIENVSSNNSNYLVEVEKYNKIGSDNEGVILSLYTEIKLWFFLIRFIGLKREIMFQCMH